MVVSEIADQKMVFAFQAVFTLETLFTGQIVIKHRITVEVRLEILIISVKTLVLLIGSFVADSATLFLAFKVVHWFGAVDWAVYCEEVGGVLIAYAFIGEMATI